MKKIGKIVLIVVIVIFMGIATFLYLNYNNKDLKVVGTDPKTGLILIEIEYCSDVCPDNTQIYTIFKDIKSEEECAKIGGFEIHDPAWGSYLGCGPSE